MALPGSSAFFKAPTALEQLLEEINFQRTKEMRQLMKDESGFVVLQGTSYWTDLFVRHFLFQTEHCIDCDDLLFFVRKKHIKSSSRYLPKFETEVDVFRKASRKLPIGDPDMDWEETVYLNLIIHQFDYTLTLAICTRTSPKELQVLKRHSQKVYASPSRRRMDTKAEAEEMTYPNVCFMVDNFNEVFCDILVRDGEMVCVELVASDRDGAVQGVIFLGSIRYDALKRVYDARSSLSSKVAQRMTFGLFSNSSSQRVEFVRMKGPQGKGHAEMAVTKPKGYGAETPTSEPGYCATDMWDTDWDSDPEDFFVYRHQRRLSDPSANINNFVRGGWKTKPADSAGAKSRSENEGLDSLANGLNEIEAGDLRDDCEFCKHTASTVCKPSVSQNVASSSLIASFFPVNKMREAHDVSASAQANSTASHSNENATPNPRLEDPPSSAVSTPVAHDPLNDPLVSHKLKDETFNYTGTEPVTVNNDASSTDTIISTITAEKTSEDESDEDDFEDCLSSLSETTPVAENGSCSTQDSPVHRELWKDASDVCAHNKIGRCEECALEKLERFLANSENEGNSNRYSEVTDPVGSAYQNAQDETVLVREVSERTGEGVGLPLRVCKTDISKNVEDLRDLDSSWTQEKPCSDIPSRDCESSINEGTKQKAVCKHGIEGSCILCGSRRPFFAKLRERHNAQFKLLEEEEDLVGGPGQTMLSFGRRIKERNFEQSNSFSPLASAPAPCPESEPELPAEPKSPMRHCRCRSLFRRRKTDSSCRRDAHPEPLPPHRVMPDGTSIYYWCDVADRPPDQTEHELDDGAYNPLWTMRGFTQTFHFWKENKRAQSVPLNAFLTYITLPWWSIAKDILDHREKPILTF